MSKPCLRAVITAAVASAGIFWTASPASANHTSGFVKTEYQVTESDGYVELSVGGDPCCPPGSGQFDYHTANLTAIAGTDYEQTSGTVTFAACLPCTIRVPIMGDELFESEEQFEVRLTNFKGTLAPQDPQRRRAVVRIIDDDPKPSGARTGPVPSTADPPSKPAGHSSVGGSAGAVTLSKESSASLPKDPGSADLADTSVETRSPENETPVPSVAKLESASPFIPIVGLGAVIILSGSAFWLVRRRKVQTDRR